MIILDPHLQALLSEEARHAFPKKCCGFLFGKQDHNRLLLTDLQIVSSTTDNAPGNYFDIDPLEYLRAERYAQRHQLTLLGYYCSHPNRPVLLSEQDQVDAHPLLALLAIEVYGWGEVDIRAWRPDGNGGLAETKVVTGQHTESARSATAQQASVVL